MVFPGKLKGAATLVSSHENSSGDKKCLPGQTTAGDTFDFTGKQQEGILIFPEFFSNFMNEINSSKDILIIPAVRVNAASVLL